MPEPWNSATQVARNLKGIDLDRISIIQVDLPEAAGFLPFERTKVALSMGVVVFAEIGKIAHDAQQGGAIDPERRKVRVLDQGANALSQYHAPILGVAEVGSQLIIESGNARCIFPAFVVGHFCEIWHVLVSLFPDGAEGDGVHRLLPAGEAGGWECTWRADRGGGGSPALHGSVSEGRVGRPPRSPSAARTCRAKTARLLGREGEAAPSLVGQASLTAAPPHL